MTEKYHESHRRLRPSVKFYYMTMACLKYANCDDMVLHLYSIFDQLVWRHRLDPTEVLIVLNCVDNHTVEEIRILERSEGVLVKLLEHENSLSDVTKLQCERCHETIARDVTFSCNDLCKLVQYCSATCRDADVARHRRRWHCTRSLDPYHTAVALHQMRIITAKLWLSRRNLPSMAARICHGLSVVRDRPFFFVIDAARSFIGVIFDEV